MDEVPTLFVVLSGSSVDVTTACEAGGAGRFESVTVGERTVEQDVAAAVARWQAREAVVAIDQRFMGFLRKRAIDALDRLGVAMPCRVDPSAHVGRDVRFGVGVQVGARALIGAGSRIGDHVHVWAGAQLGSAVHVDRFSTIDAGCIVGDRARVGSHTWIRSGSVLDPDTVIEGSVELMHVGRRSGIVPEGTIELPGLDGPARIHRFGR